MIENIANELLAVEAEEAHEASLVVTTVRVPPAVKARVERLAARYGVSQNYLLSAFIDEGSTDLCKVLADRVGGKSKADRTAFFLELYEGRESA